MAEPALVNEPATAVGEPLLEVDQLVKHYPVRRGALLGGGGIVRYAGGDVWIR